MEEAPGQSAGVKRIIVVKYVISLAALSFAFAGAAIAAPLSEQAAAPTYTAAQANTGRDEYVTYCVDCHGKNLNDGEFGGPPLIGQAFRDKWLGRPASALLGYVAAAMPPEARGRLPRETYGEIVAYILSANGVVASDAPVNAATPAAPAPK